VASYSRSSLKEGRSGKKDERQDQEKSLNPPEKYGLCRVSGIHHIPVFKLGDRKGVIFCFFILITGIIHQYNQEIYTSALEFGEAAFHDVSAAGWGSIYWIF
jgi:hypothetical protein